MEEFLIGAGMALLLALIAWSDSIRSFHKDTLDLEKEFSVNSNLDLRKVRVIIRNYSNAAKRIAELNKLVQTKKHIEFGIIDELIKLDTERQSLERRNNNKYWLIIILTNLCIVSGIVNYFIGEDSSFCIFNLSIKTQFIPILICVIFIYITLYNTVSIYKAEQRYSEKLNNIIDKI